MMASALPPELERVRQYARRAIAPIKPSDENTQAEKDFLFAAKRTEGGRSLPPYYLVYFLLVELLGFKDLGQFEKVAWSVPIDFNGRAYLIEHRKFGLGIFARSEDEPHAVEIAKLIKRGVRIAQPFFRWKADQAVQASKFNVVNNGSTLFGRYQYMRSLYDDALVTLSEYRAQEKRRSQQRELRFWSRILSSKIDKTASLSELVATYRFPSATQSERVNWLALGAIDAFFGWTEHIFIHLAILQSRIKTGDEVAQLIGTEWNIKFKRALDISDKDTKLHLDKMVAIRQQLRNFVAHGAFGKEGEAFNFHSRAGAVPVAFHSDRATRQFSLGPALAFNNAEALASIAAFIDHMWSGPRAPARIYIQESDLAVVLTMASDGKYARAMQSDEEMRELVDYLTGQNDNAGNMDW